MSGTVYRASTKGYRPPASAAWRPGRRLLTACLAAAGAVWFPAAASAAVPPARGAPPGEDAGGDVPPESPDGGGERQEATITRPPFSFLRQNEDWSVLAGLPAAQRRRFDAIKLVPLDGSRSSWVSFGGSARGRLEGWHDFAFGVPANDDDLFSLWRFMGHADLHAGKRFRGFVELKSALAGHRELPGGERPLDADTFELQQAFVDVTAVGAGDTRLFFRLGRRGLKFGKERLVSPLPWGNTLRHWDGLSATVSRGRWTTSSFWTRPVVVDKTDLNRPDSSRSFYGVHATRGGGEPLDLYVLGQGRDETTFDGSPGHEDRYTFGGRLDLQVGERSLRVETEAALQVGRTAGADIRAWMLAVEVTGSLEARAGSPKAGLVVEIATGDDAAGGDAETFDQLFPLGHAYLGIADFVGRQNIVAVSVPVSLRPAPRWRLSVRPYLFRRYTSGDALYNAGGAVVFPGTAGTSRDIGVEIDAVASFRVDDHTTASGGYARFFAGSFVEQAGGDEDIDFAYAQIEFRF